MEGAVWIPEKAEDLQLRLYIIAHTGPSGYRASKVTRDPLRRNFFWTALSSNVSTFFHSCIHCLPTVGRGKVPRFFGPAVHGTGQNYLLQFNYIEIEAATSGEEYVLMLRDEYLNYCWLFAFPDTLVENAARAIIDWSAAFGAPKGLMSDGPTHFKNETLRLVAKGLRVPHHFTLQYKQLSNCAVERLGEELLRVFRAVSSELQLRPEEWPDLLPIVNSALNNAPSSQCGGVSPIRSLTGMDATPPFLTFYRSSVAAPVTVFDVLRERLLDIQRLLELVSALHPVLQDALQKKRQILRNQASKGKLPDFTKGDFVLVARNDLTAGENYPYVGEIMERY